ncbi:MAG TPA: BON domain-containing protein [Trinickia sp.]|jgi:osmotically-inducible protein OsmY|nr:BON domain-containing protein [Trinickia sp.]
MTSLKKIAMTFLTIAALFGAANASAQTVSGTAGGSAQLSKKAMRAEDRQLAKKVRHALTKTKHLTSSDIVILAKDGVVTLDGTVPTEEEIQLAAATAGSVAGVQSVKNNLSMHESGH